MQIIRENNKEEKVKITRYILESLTDWFGIDESREEYIEKSKDLPFFYATENDDIIGFIYLKETSKDTIELYVMGVLKEYHRKGVGRKLFETAKSYSIDNGYSFIQVKTVQMGVYSIYDETNYFYQSLGFKELEGFPTLWDEWNPCQIYIMALNK